MSDGKEGQPPAAAAAAAAPAAVVDADGSATGVGDEANIDVDQIQIKVEPVMAAVDIASKLWDEYYAECLKDTAAALSNTLDAGRASPAAPAPTAAAAVDVKADAKSDAKSDAKTEDTKPDAAEAVGGSAAANGKASALPLPEPQAAAAAAPAASASSASGPAVPPLSAAAEGSVAITITPVRPTSASVGGSPGAPPTPPNSAAPLDDAAAAGAGAGSGRASVDSRSSGSGQRNPNHLNWSAIQSTADSEARRIDEAHLPIKERIYDAYDTANGGAGALPVGAAKQLVVEALNARRRIVETEVALLIRNGTAAAMAVVRTMSGVSPAVASAYEQHISAQLSRVQPQLVGIARSVLEKALVNAENLSIALHTAMDVDRDGKLRKPEFLAEWKRAIDDLVDYQPVLSKLRQALAQ